METKQGKDLVCFLMLLAFVNFLGIATAWSEDTKVKKSWEISDGVIPEDLRLDLEEIANRKTVFETEDFPDPPWKAFPRFERGSMGWRMGTGEDYMLGFRKWYSELDEEKKSYYSFMHPEPNDWMGFYSGLNG